MHDFDGVGAYAVENQVIAERTSADTEMFVARHQRIATRRIRQRLAFSPQLLHEIECDFDTLLGYVGCNLFEIGFGLGGNDNDHSRAALALALSFDSRRSNTCDVDSTRPAAASATPRAIEASRAASRVSRS